MRQELPSKPAMRVREALNELLRKNSPTEGKEVGEMYLGPEVFIARLRRPRVLEGDWSEVDRIVDLLDLIEEHQRGELTSSSGPIERNESSSLIFPGKVP